MILLHPIPSRREVSIFEWPMFYMFTKTNRITTNFTIISISPHLHNWVFVQDMNRVKRKMAKRYTRMAETYASNVHRTVCICKSSGQKSCSARSHQLLSLSLSFLFVLVIVVLIVIAGAADVIIFHSCAEHTQVKCIKKQEHNTILFTQICIIFPNSMLFVYSNGISQSFPSSAIGCFSFATRLHWITRPQMAIACKFEWMKKFCNMRWLSLCLLKWFHAKEWINVITSVDNWRCGERAQQRYVFMFTFFFLSVDSVRERGLLPWSHGNGQLNEWIYTTAAIGLRVCVYL